MCKCFISISHLWWSSPTSEANLWVFAFHKQTNALWQEQMSCFKMPHGPIHKLKRKRKLRPAQGPKKRDPFLLLFQ